MKKERLSLDRIKVESFITTFDTKTFRTIKGGTLQDDNTDTYGDNGSLDCNNANNTEEDTCQTNTETAGLECMNNASLPPCNIG